MHIIYSLRRVTSALLVIQIIFILVGQADPTFSFENKGFSKKVSGTYLSVEGKETILLQIIQDGNLTAIFSSQFSGGALDDPFSNSLGAWERSGKREITAQVVDITFQGQGGGLVGVGAGKFFIRFDKTFQSAKFRCRGAIFPPGVNPFDRDAEPISGSDFTCADDELVFHRLPPPMSAIHPRDPYYTYDE